MQSSKGKASRTHDSHRSLKEIIDLLALLHDLLVQNMVDRVDYDLISDKHVNAQMDIFWSACNSATMLLQLRVAWRYAADLPYYKSHKLEDLVVQLDVGAFNGVDSKILNMHPHVDLVHLGHLSCRILLHG